MEALKRVLSTLVWAILLFAQHVVCFDAFDTNLWYFYILAMILALAQMALLRRHKRHRVLLVACGLTYSAVGVLKTLFTLISIFQGGWQLSLFCQILDLAGAAHCFWIARTHCPS